VSQRKRTFWVDEDRGPVVGWSELSTEWDAPTFELVASELEARPADEPTVPAHGPLPLSREWSALA
jgi:hypothetical protein